MPLRVGYVREHFSSPLLQFAAADKGETFTLVECPSGTGQLISRLTSDEIDIAIALTDPLVSGLANGSTAYRLVGSFVATSLNWAVIAGAGSKYGAIADLQGTTLGISRPGSGSQTMAYVMALQQGWPTDAIKFQVNNDIHGLIDSVNAGTTSAFMWEWFTTKPFADAGVVRFIGSVPTPWPSWLIAAHTDVTRAPPTAVLAFLHSLDGYTCAFGGSEARVGPSIDYIKDNFGYPAADIEAWLKTVSYPPQSAAIPRVVITETLSVLEQAGVIKAPAGGFHVADFVDAAVVALV